MGFRKGMTPDDKPTSHQKRICDARRLARTMFDSLCDTYAIGKSIHVYGRKNEKSFRLEYWSENDWQVKGVKR